jgi:hypothetical protein
MTIDCDDSAERQARVDIMIREFREAQLRRSAKANGKAVQSTSDQELNAPRPGTAVSE